MMSTSPTGRPIERIVVVGTTGSGKTTFARELARQLDASHVELDALFWGPDWKASPDRDFLPAVERATRGRRWVVDGNYSRTRPIVWPRAEMVIWLDYPFTVVFGRLLRRTLRRALTGEQLWDGCRERWGTALFSRHSILMWCLKTYRRRRKVYRQLFQDPEYRHLRTVRLDSPGRAAVWLRRLSAEGRPSDTAFPQND